MDCKYIEHDQRLKGEFINGLDGENMVEEIITDLTALLWTKRVEVKRVQKRYGTI